jgi:hypothetical protein
MGSFRPFCLPSLAASPRQQTSFRSVPDDPVIYVNGVFGQQAS